MREYKRHRIVPDMDSVHVMKGFANPCEECEDWGEACETCGVSVPLVTGRYKVEEVTYAHDSICGIPVGEPYPREKKFLGYLQRS